MKVLWICGLPRRVQREVLERATHDAQEWSWILGHLPPPPGIELHVACRTSPGAVAREFMYEGACFHLVPVKVRARVYCLFQFDWLSYRDVFARVRPDVVHGWGTEDAHGLVAIRLSPSRHIVEVQGNLNAYLARVTMPWQTRFAALSERVALAKARCVAAENEYSLGSALPMIRTKDCHVIEHPIRPDFLTATPSTGKSRQVLFLGTIDDRKGIWDAVEAFRVGAPPNWKLAIVGSGEALNMARLGRLLAELGLSERIVHYPQLGPTEIISLMQSSSVFLLPTRIDTGPTALKEALAMGLWPVCYDNSGPGHYMRKFGYGSLVKDLNRADLTNTLKQTLSGEPWKETRHIGKVRNMIRPHFERGRIWNDLSGLYRRIGENPRRD